MDNEHRLEPFSGQLRHAVMSLIAALAIRMSTRPNSATVDSISRSQAFESAMSAAR
jgi:hypothetical protein